MKQTQSFIAGLYLIFSYWIRARQKEYWVNVRGCYPHAATGEVTVKYQIANTRVVSEASLNNFLNSQHVHFVHPQQLYHLGFVAREVVDQQHIVKSSPSSLGQRILRRVFFYE
jgi:hypothetical protein